MPYRLKHKPTSEELDVLSEGDNPSGSIARLEALFSKHKDYAKGEYERQSQDEKDKRYKIFEEHLASWRDEEYKKEEKASEKRLDSLNTKKVKSKSKSDSTSIQDAMKPSKK